MIRVPPRSTRTDTLCPDPTLVRSAASQGLRCWWRLRVRARNGRGHHQHPCMPAHSGRLSVCRLYPTAPGRAVGWGTRGNIPCPNGAIALRGVAPFLLNPTAERKHGPSTYLEAGNPRERHWLAFGDRKSTRLNSSH